MDKLLNVYLARADAEDSGVQIWLPAQPYELRDVLEKARLTEDSALSLALDDFGDKASFFVGVIEMSTDLRMIRGLNAFAWKVADMKDPELSGFEWLVRYTSRDGEYMISHPDLYDLAATTSCLHYFPNITDDEELGRYLVAHGSSLELTDNPNSETAQPIWKLGLKHRESHGGNFLGDCGWYMEWAGDIAEEWKDLDLSPREPDYTVLLEVRNPDDKGRTATLKLPAAVAEINAVLDSLGIADNTEPSIQCLDCRVPALAELITGYGRIAGANDAACRLKEMAEKDIPIYGAILATVPCTTLEAALSQMDQVDQCILTPEIKSPADMGKAELTFMLGEDGAETLLPFVNLPAYGMELLKKENTVLTPYGAIDRKDCQPLLGLEARTADDGHDGRQNSTVPQEQAAKPSQDGRRARKSGRMDR